MTKLDELKELLEKIGSPSRRVMPYLVARRLDKAQEVIDFLKNNNIDFANADDEENPDSDRAYLDYLKVNRFLESLLDKYGYDTSRDDA